MERIYWVTFDTQRDRRYITWGYYVSANNQKEAKEKAYQHWNSSRNTYYNYGFGRNGKWHDVPHMWHTAAIRMTPGEADRGTIDRGIENFYIIQNKYASWGYRG